MSSEGVVFTNGCFDALHAGHLSFLNFCKKLKKKYKLYVVLDSDYKIKKSKGKNRPLFTFQERLNHLMQTGIVDKVFVSMSDKDLLETYKFFKPEILVKGEEWRGKKIIGAEYAKQLIYAPRGVEISTSLIEERVLRKI